jgi:hypothetical protein
LGAGFTPLLGAVVVVAAGFAPLVAAGCAAAAGFAPLLGVVVVAAGFIAPSVPVTAEELDGAEAGVGSWPGSMSGLFIAPAMYSWRPSSLSSWRAL